jgi:hypothetical protein
MAYSKLGNHVMKRHGITMAKYKQEFGISARTGMTSAGHREKMRAISKELNSIKNAHSSEKHKDAQFGNRPHPNKGRELGLQERRQREVRNRAMSENKKKEYQLTDKSSGETIIFKGRRELAKYLSCSEKTVYNALHGKYGMKIRDRYVVEEVGS